jgi:hypothetical protein
MPERSCMEPDRKPSRTGCPEKTDRMHRRTGLDEQFVKTRRLFIRAIDTILGNWEIKHAGKYIFHVLKYINNFNVLGDLS